MPPHPALNFFSLCKIILGSHSYHNSSPDHSTPSLLTKDHPTPSVYPRLPSTPSLTTKGYPTPSDHQRLSYVFSDHQRLSYIFCHCSQFLDQDGGQAWHISVLEPLLPSCGCHTGYCPEPLLTAMGAYRKSAFSFFPCGSFRIERLPAASITA